MWQLSPSTSILALSTPFCAWIMPCWGWSVGWAALQAPGAPAQPLHRRVREGGGCSLLCQLCPLQHWDNDSGNAERVFKSTKLTLKKNKIIYKTAWLWLSYTNSCKRDLQQYHLKYKVTKINRFVMSPVTVELKTPKLNLPACRNLPPGLACTLFLGFGFFRALLTIRMNLIPKDPPGVKQLSHWRKHHNSIFH